MHRDYAEGVTFMQIHRAELGFADAAGALQHRLEHRLQLAWRTTDHLENLGRRGLLLQGFAYIISALTQLVQQARVLDGDEDLLGKIAHKLDLLVGKWPCFPAADEDSADSGRVVEQWHDQGRSMTIAESHLFALRILVAVEEVWHMDRPRFEHRPAGHPVAVERLSMTKGKSTEWPGVRTGHYDIAVAKHDPGVQRLAETGSTRDDRVEHCLDVGRRTRDDAQYLGSRCLLV